MADIVKRGARYFIPRLFVFLSKFWYGSCRITQLGAEHMRYCEEHQPFIAAFWHNSILYMFHHLRRFSGTVMVSASRDGDYIAEVARLTGMEAVRGSSNRQGMRALREFIVRLKQGGNGGIVADGSQGPALKVQAGAIMLASKTGIPILPIVWSASRYWAFNSWDRTILPKPFSRLVVAYGEPLRVPDGLKPEQMEHYRCLLEEDMKRLYRRAWQEFGKQDH